MLRPRTADHERRPPDRSELALGRPIGTDPRLLLVETAGGSKQAFGELYDVVGAQVFAAVSVLAPDRESAEQLTTAAFQEVWIRAPRYRPAHDDAVTWILRVAYGTTQAAAGGRPAVQP